MDCRVRPSGHSFTPLHVSRVACIYIIPLQGDCALSVTSAQLIHADVWVGRCTLQNINTCRVDVDEKVDKECYCLYERDGDDSHDTLSWMTPRASIVIAEQEPWYGLGDRPVHPTQSFCIFGGSHAEYTSLHARKNQKHRPWLVRLCPV